MRSSRREWLVCLRSLRMQAATSCGSTIGSELEWPHERPYTCSISGHQDFASIALVSKRSLPNRCLKDSGFCQEVWSLCAKYIRSAVKRDLQLHPYRTTLSTTTMATELTVQSERAFQKQPHIFLNQKSKATKSKKVGKGGRRWFKDVGLGFRTPKNAIEGSYIGMSNSWQSTLDSDEPGVMRKN